MRKLLFRVLRYVLVFFVLLVALGVILGATGFSDKMLSGVINEELRGVRQNLAQTIRDPGELESVMEIRRYELEELHGLNDPWYTRMPQQMGRILKGDFGCAKTLRSFSGSCDIGTIIFERMPNTIILTTISFVFAVGLATYLAGLAAMRPGSIIDRIISFWSVISNALPSWWIGILAILVFAIQLAWLPSGGMYSAPPPIDTLPRLLDVLKHAILPVATLTFASLGYYTYEIRAILLKEAQEPYVQFARARGLSEARIRMRYIFRAAAPSIVTIMGLGFALSFTGAILTETVFNWPGMGRLYIDSLLNTPDMGIILALSILFALIYMAMRFVLDIFYVILDPRMRT